jgi:peptide/nickel transport system substrate-binding protein
MQRRDFLTGAGMVLAGLAAPAIVKGDETRVLRVVPHSPLTSLDPLASTALITRVHGFMVYDQLVAVDADFRPQPQMADGWTTETDGKTWTFKLRDKLVFHDGAPVLARDCVASIRRWWARDGLGQALAAATETLDAPDDHTIRFRLTRPFPQLAYALGKPGPVPLFILPERLATAQGPLTDATGSGPFRFLPDAWTQGRSSAWERFDGYVPRTEFPDGTAGAKKANVDRIEWTSYKTPDEAAAALEAGEQHYWENPALALIPALVANKEITVQRRLNQGAYAMMLFNHLQPPFNNEAIRRAVLMGVDQSAFLRAIAGDDAKQWGVCEAFFTCDGPSFTEAGQAALQVRSVEKAAAALKAAGYKGEKTVVLIPAEWPQMRALGQVTADLLRKIGFTVDVATVDTATMARRRASKEPVDKGGWSVMNGVWLGGDLVNPAVNEPLRANGRDAWYGWPDDPELERLRASWLTAASASEQQKLLDAIQLRAFQSVPYVPLGFWWLQSAWRKTVTGVFRSPITTFWNIGLKA